MESGATFADSAGVSPRRRLRVATVAGDVGGVVECTGLVVGACADVQLSGAAHAGSAGVRTWDRQVALRMPVPSARVSIAMPPSMTGTRSL